MVWVYFFFYAQLLKVNATAVQNWAQNASCMQKLSILLLPTSLFPFSTLQRRLLLGHLRNRRKKVTCSWTRTHLEFLIQKLRGARELVAATVFQQDTIRSNRSGLLISRRWAPLDRCVFYLVDILVLTSQSLRIYVHGHR